MPLDHPPDRRQGRDFFRKGQVGDHQNFLTDADRALLREKYASVIAHRLPYSP